MEIHQGAKNISTITVNYWELDRRLFLHLRIEGKQASSAGHLNFKLMIEALMKLIRCLNILKVQMKLVDDTICLKIQTFLLRILKNFIERSDI